MLTVSMDENNKTPLYEQLYYHIRQDIVNGALKQGERLPSKRKLAYHLQVSVNTVENAYAQLIAEGYIKAIEKKGYYVRKIEAFVHSKDSTKPFFEYSCKENTSCRFDMKTNAVDTDNFPFSVWTKLMREALREERISLLSPNQPQGDLSLRLEIARHLKSYRNMDVSAEQIVLGAGTEYLLGLIAEILPEAIFALENPCNHKHVKIFDSRRVSFCTVAVDDEGMSMDMLRKTTATAPIITPSRHFPLCTVMSINRRMQMLKWAADGAGRFLVENDFDSEYRYMLKQIPTLHSLDRNDSVIYMNTFARTLSPSLRIGYMVLPLNLMERYRNNLPFYSCTVSKFEQSTLKRFLRGGYYDRHLSRMRLIYKSRRDAFLEILTEGLPSFKLSGHEAGLHLLITSGDGLTEDDLLRCAEKVGVRVYGLSGYYNGETCETGTVIAGYGGLEEDELREAAQLLVGAWSYK